MSESLGAPPNGRQVLADRYELRELIGQGGMAEVHHAHDRLLDRPVAVKIFRPRDDPAAQRRFDDEARALARLAHPGLVAIFDVGTVGDRPFLVMEFVEGTSLQSRLRGGPLPLREVLRIGGVLADALAHAHDRGVVHRDVKPSNIMLDQEDLPHLTDFGIALLAGSPRLTSVNEIVGTPAYLAPEQLANTPVGPPADVYALGLVLLECVTGQVEYPSGTSLEVALSRLSRPPRIPANLPADVAALLTAMTSTAAVDRPTAQACAQRLLAAFEDPVDDRTSDVALPLAPVAWWADEDRTARVPAEPVTAVARTGPRWRLAAASVAGVAAVVVALVLMLGVPHVLTGQPRTGADARTPIGSSTRTTTSADRPTAAHDSGPAAPAFVANEHHAARTTTPPPAPSTHRNVDPPAATTSPATTPPRTTAATQPPTTTQPAPSQPTTTTTQPPSTDGGPSGGPGDGGSGQ